MDATQATGSRPTRLYFDLRRIVWWWFLVVGSGGFVAALIGGAGGRLVMFILRLTSPESLRGIETDDGAIIGEFTVGGTFFLVMFVAVLGGFYGGFYGLVRSFITPSWRVPLSAAFAGLVGGSLLVHEDGIDFRLLAPRAFAVVSFVAIPALIGLGTAWLVERWSDRETMTLSRKVTLVLGLIPTFLFFPAAGLGIAACVVLAVFAQFGPIRTLVDATAVRWIVQFGLVAVSLVAAIALVRTATAVLT